MIERNGIIAAGNMLVDHVHQIEQWPQRGWLAEIVHSERSTGGAPLNVLLTLAKCIPGCRCRRWALLAMIMTVITLWRCSTSIRSIANTFGGPPWLQHLCHKS